MADKPISPIEKLIKEQDALITDLVAKLREARTKRDELARIAEGQRLAAKHGINS